MATPKEPTALPQIKPAMKIIVDDVVYERFPVKTRLISFSENLESVLEENVRPFLQKGDWVMISEKVVSVCQNRVRHQSTVKVSALARLIQKGVKKHKTMTAWDTAIKIQVAIDEAGVWRIIPAMVFGAAGKVFGIRGVFWIIAGNRVSQIDGFTPEGMYPYTEYGILPAKNPQKLCDEIEKKLRIPIVIADANYINVKILGVSKGIGLSYKTVREILLDNPLGQGNYMTPFAIVRKIK